MSLLPFSSGEQKVDFSVSQELFEIPKRWREEGIPLTNAYKCLLPS